MLHTPQSYSQRAQQEPGGVNRKPRNRDLEMDRNVPTAVGVLGGSLLSLESWEEWTGDQGVGGQEESRANKAPCQWN